MSFDTPNGTYGTRQPKAGLLMRWFNGWTMNRIRRKGGEVMGMDALVLTTVGRKSGAERSPPSPIFPTAMTPGSSWHRRTARPNIPPGTTTSPPIPTKSKLKSPVARLASVPNSSTGRHANRHGDASRTSYLVSRSTNRKPTANCRSSVCKPAQHPRLRRTD
jgi:hypothetical protein